MRAVEPKPLSQKLSRMMIRILMKIRGRWTRPRSLSMLSLSMSLISFKRSSRRMPRIQQRLFQLFRPSHQLLQNLNKKPSTHPKTPQKLNNMPNLPRHPRTRPTALQRPLSTHQLLPLLQPTSPRRTRSATSPPLKRASTRCNQSSPR